MKLDISQQNLAKGIDLSCYPQLEELNCEVCNLATLDLSNNKNLRLLRCNHNALTQLDLPTTTLEHLECASNRKVTRL
jgi:Leucine-rich repeat (LRR) protein